MRVSKTWFEQNGLVLLLWLPTALSALSLKYNILRAGGFHDSALSVRPSGVLSLAEKVLLFRSDVLVSFVLIPLLLCSLTHFFSARLRLALSAVLAAAIEILLFLEYIAYSATGNFTTLKTIWAASLWAIKNHDSSVVPTSSMDVVQFMAWAVVFGATTKIAFARLNRDNGWISRAAVTTFGVAVIVTIVAAMPSMSEMLWSRPLIETAVQGALLEKNSDQEMLSRSIPELLRLYRETAAVPASSQSDLVGKARGYNVLFFVMEATPAWVFDPAGDSLQDMPNVRRLRKHAFLSSKHYTSFPLTNRAAFSIFTSLYTKCAAGCGVGDRRVQMPGIVSSLRDEGYKTGFYGFVWKVSHERDDRMLTSLGFQKIAEPTIDPSVDREGAETFYGSVEYVEKHDRQVFQLLREDIRQWADQKQRFVAAFFPEMGHDPWRALKDLQCGSERERGRALAVHQDAWLGELIEELEHDGVLDHTIIVVTSDHGVRMLTPEPHRASHVISHGKLDDVIIHVPLLIYVPKVLSHPVKFDWPTSHIDIAPTLLDLVGVTTHRELEEGTAIWNPGLSNRRLYLPMDTFGAAGFCENGTYYMSSSMDAVFKSSTLHFGDGDALAMNSAEAVKTRKILARQDDLQTALLAHLHACAGHF